MESREYTEEETRDTFLEHLHTLVDYWYNVKQPTKDRMNGLVFSILATLDGDSAGIPGFIVAPSTHETDKDYHIRNGENYYPQNNDSTVKCDIAGCLHEMWHKKEK